MFVVNYHFFFKTLFLMFVVVLKLFFCWKQKASWMKHQQIDATISQVSKFHMFLYLITMSFKHLQKVLGRSDRERKIMVVGRQDSTRLDPCSLQHEVLCEVGVSW